MTIGIARREFIAGLGGAAVAWPLGAGAQQAMPVIGFLHGASLGPYAAMVVAFRHGLSETGYVESRNVAIEFRWAESHYDRLPELAADLVRRQVSVIAAITADAAVAAKAATTNIPIVFETGDDPVNVGFVASLNRPGGNLTGVSTFTVLLGAKRLELLHELVPKATMIGILVNPTNANAESTTKDLQAAARALGLQTHVQSANSDSEFDAAFTTLVQLGAGALVIGSDPFFSSRRDHIAALAARHRVPAMYPLREYAAAGGLTSYGTSLVDVYRQVGVYTGRILKGEKPADLPVIQPTKFEFVVNIKTAKALGLIISESFLVRADEVIE
jgi:putative tryptophan/tyrosine transport system substrate-binding protein